MATGKDLNDDTSKLLQTVIEVFEKEDRATRERQVRHYRRLKMYWNNMNRIYWSETARDYRIAGNLDSTSGGDLQQAYYDRPINVFRAFLETIIAALSIQVPAVRCVPGDADNPLDISTAKAGNIISEQIYKQNNVINLWLNALYVYCTEGLIGCYNYVEEDEKYGTYEERKFTDVETESYICPSCGAELSDEAYNEGMLAPDEMGPMCPECLEPLPFDLEKTPGIKSKHTGTDIKPKSKVCLEVFGGLYIKIANYAKKQSDTPYLNLTYDTHYANALEMYPDLRGKISKDGNNPGGGGISGYDSYDTNYRQNVEYGGETPEGNVTVRYRWLRPAAFNVLPEDQCNTLKAEFPDGCKAVFVNDQCAEYVGEDMDDCWTLTQNPMSDYLTHEPMGELLTNVQDIVNDLISLTLQTIEHGVTQVWADPAVVNFNGQSQLESNPGMLTAVKPQSSTKNISDGFFTTSAATLSPEVFSFYKIVQELGQFTSGAMPSIFGGVQSGASSRTASEYAMQKSMALQRLQTPWKMLTIWWKEIFSKAIPAYMQEVKADERVVSKDQNGNYINTFIKKSELGGQIGDIELEGSDQMPVSDEQKADVIMRLMELNNMEIMQALTTPENLPMVRKIVKIPEFKLPGEDDRTKQYEEINKLINGEMVEVELDVDIHPIHADICRSWLVSDAGRLAKDLNPVGYMMVLEHMKMHQEIIAMQMEAQAQMQAQQEADSDQNSKLPKGKSEIKGEKDVRTPVQ